MGLGGAWERGWGCPAPGGEAGALPGTPPAGLGAGRERTDLPGKDLAEAAKAVTLSGCFGARSPNVFF